jgi:hypothetical protein
LPERAPVHPQWLPTSPHTHLKQPGARQQQRQQQFGKPAHVSLRHPATPCTDAVIMLQTTTDAARCAPFLCFIHASVVHQSVNVRVVPSHCCCQAPD